VFEGHPRTQPLAADIGEVELDAAVGGIGPW
jgi:hypothetical protein